MAQTASRPILSQLPLGMSHYIVLFDEWRNEQAEREQAGGDQFGGRGEQVQAQIALSEKHRERLTSFIASEGLESDVMSIAAPTALGAIGIIATQDAAKRLAGMSGVLRVMPAR